MKVDREILEKELMLVCESIAKDKKVINKVENELLKEHNILPGEIRGLMNGTIPLMSVSLEMLFVLTKALYKYTKLEAINPERYFTRRRMIMF